MHQNRWRLGLCRRPHWGSLQRTPRPPTWNQWEGRGWQGLPRLEITSGYALAGMFAHVAITRGIYFRRHFPASNNLSTGHNWHVLVKIRSENGDVCFCEQILLHWITLIYLAVPGRPKEWGVAYVWLARASLRRPNQTVQFLAHFVTALSRTTNFNSFVNFIAHCCSTRRKMTTQFILVKDHPINGLVLTFPLAAFDDVLARPLCFGFRLKSEVFESFF